MKGLSLISKASGHDLLRLLAPLKNRGFVQNIIYSYVSKDIGFRKMAVMFFDVTIDLD